jgi:hypothetical protein
MSIRLFQIISAEVTMRPGGVQRTNHDLEHRSSMLHPKGSTQRICEWLLQLQPGDEIHQPSQ